VTPDQGLLGDVGLGDAESRGVLNESALVSGRHIFGGHFTFPIAQTRDARALYGKWSGISLAHIAPRNLN
jgi:hypothetical protein